MLDIDLKTHLTFIDATVEVGPELNEINMQMHLIP